MIFPKDIQNDTKVNSGKPYTIFFNSGMRNSGGSTQFATYNFDWSILPDRPYKVYFSFVASDSNAYVGATSPAAYINVDLGQVINSYSPASNRQLAQLSFNLGTLRKTISSGANYYLYANKNDNPPIYINGRPTNPKFLVSILADTGYAFDNSMLGSYILTLYFEPA